MDVVGQGPPGEEEGVIVGTAAGAPQGGRPGLFSDRGRVLLLCVSGPAFRVVCEIALTAGVTSLAVDPRDPSRVVVCCGHCVCLLRLRDGRLALESALSPGAFPTAVAPAGRGEFLVGDGLLGLSLLQISRDGGLSTVFSEGAQRGISALAPVTEDLFLAADCHGNLLSFSRSAGRPASLVLAGRIHIGERINSIRRVSPASPAFICGTACGRLLCVRHEGNDESFAAISSVHSVLAVQSTSILNKTFDQARFVLVLYGMQFPQ